MLKRTPTTLGYYLDPDIKFRFGCTIGDRYIHRECGAQAVTQVIPEVIRTVCELSVDVFTCFHIERVGRNLALLKFAVIDALEQAYIEHLERLAACRLARHDAWIRRSVFQHVITRDGGRIRY